MMKNFLPKGGSVTMSFPLEYVDNFYAENWPKSPKILITQIPIFRRKLVQIGENFDYDNWRKSGDQIGPIFSFWSTIHFG
jgi:hypothetical protein